MNPYYDSGYWAALGGLLILGFVLAIASYVIYSLFMMKVFEKAGVEGKWRAWVPVYNTMIFFKLGDLSPWLVLYCLGGALLLSWIGIGALFSIAMGVLSVLAAWRIGLKLQKDAIWVVLYIFLSIVWLGINAFDKSRWNTNVAPAPWAGNGFLGDRTVWQGIPAQPSAAQPQAGYAAPGYGAPQGYTPPAPQGYAPPAQPGYAPPAQPGYAPPAQPGYTPPATGAPTTPPAPPTPPPAAPPAPPAPPTNPTQPPA